MDKHKGMRRVFGVGWVMPATATALQWSDLSLMPWPDQQHLWQSQQRAFWQKAFLFFWSLKPKKGQFSAS